MFTRICSGCFSATTRASPTPSVRGMNVVSSICCGSCQSVDYIPLALQGFRNTKFVGARIMLLTALAMMFCLGSMYHPWRVNTCQAWSLSHAMCVCATIVVATHNGHFCQGSQQTGRQQGQMLWTRSCFVSSSQTWAKTRPSYSKCLQCYPVAMALCGVHDEIISAR